SAGGCAAATVPVSGAAAGMAVVATPESDPGAGFVWQGWVSAPNTVTVRICALAAATPAATAYAVRVLP
ncbi:MAG: hypothetical protein ACRD13_09375, partial [Terriglobales bacterium]